MDVEPAVDAVVVGLGAMGSAALAHLAARGVSAIGLEAHSPAHDLSSSHGDTRIIRLGYFEDPAYVPLLRRAYENWRELERRTGRDVLSLTGVLQIGSPQGKLVSGTLRSCREHGLAHEILDAAETRRRYPAFAIDDGEVAVLEGQGGYVRPETAIEAHLCVARSHGATWRMGCRVEAIDPDRRGVTVRLRGGETIRSRRAIVATGPWIAELVPSLRGRAMPIRQVVAWYGSSLPRLTTPEAMPVFLRDEGEAGHFFGFPDIDGRGVKVGKHTHFLEPVEPDGPNAPPNERDTTLLDAFVRRRLPGARGGRLAATTCRYTMMPGETFLFDLLPGASNVVVASPCSGHGYKFASVVGEILADLAMNGGTGLPVEPFSFAAHERLRAPPGEQAHPAEAG